MTSELREVALGDICEAPQYGWTTRAVAEVNDDALHLLRTTDISRGEVNWAAVPFCAEEPRDREKYLLRDGDLVISRAGSIGFSHLVHHPPPAVFASYLIRFRPTTAVLARYLALYMKSPEYWRQVRANASGIAQPNINAKKLAAIRLPLPDLSRQAEVIERVEAALSRVDACEADLAAVSRRLRILRGSVLAAEFTALSHDGERTEHGDVDGATR